MKRARKLGPPNIYTLSFWAKPKDSNIEWEQVLKTLSRRGYFPRGEAARGLTFPRDMHIHKPTLERWNTC